MHKQRDPITHKELHDTIHGNRLNWLRAAVLGANDGIVSTSAKLKAVIRVVTGGILAMLVTFLVGKLFGVVGL